MKPKQILIFETTPADRKDLVRVFESLDHSVSAVADTASLFEHLDVQACDLMVIGACSPVTDAMALLKKIRGRHPFVPVFLSIK